MLHVQETVKAGNMNTAQCLQSHTPTTKFLSPNQLSLLLLCCMVIMHTTFTSRLCFNFPVVLLILFRISSVTNLHACEGQVYRAKGSLTQVMW